MRSCDRPLAFAVGLLGWGAFARPACAQEFGGLSFTGDGKTPSALGLLDAQSRAAAGAHHAVGASPRGEGSWGMQLQLPPAILAPSIGLQWASTTGAHAWAGRGFSIDAGMTVSRPTGPAKVGAYGDLPDVHMVGGFGLQGLLVPDLAGTRYVSDSPGTATASYDAGALTWTVNTGDVTTVLAPSNAIDWAGLGLGPVRWHTVHQETRADSNIVRLVIADHLDWADFEGHALLVQEKVNCYIAFVESGQLLRVRQPPIPADPVVTIVLTVQQEPNREAEEFLRMVTDFLAGVGLRFEVDRRYVVS
jgi:hypothetical protein